MTEKRSCILLGAFHGQYRAMMGEKDNES